jgi:hypothetical protein
MSFLVEGVNKNLEPKAQVRRIGEYEKVEEAIAAAKRTIDEFLRREFKPGTDAKALFSLYQAKGEYPFIFRTEDRTISVRGFSHAQYAMARAAELCGGAK